MSNLFLKLEYTSGIIIRVNTVENKSPPQTAVANGLYISVPFPTFNIIKHTQNSS